MSYNNSNMNTGGWLLTVVDANVIKGFDLFSKSDLYVQIKAGDKIFKTKTCRNSNYPQWNETISFPMNNNSSDIEIKVLDDDLFKDDKIAVANINFNQFPATVGDEKEYSIPLSYENKDVGILHIRIKNSTSQSSSHVNDRSNMNQSNYNQDYNNTGGYSTSGLGGHSYPQNDNNSNRNNLNNNNTNPNLRNKEMYEEQTFHPSSDINDNIPLTGNNPSLGTTTHKHQHDSNVVLPQTHQQKDLDKSKDKKHKHKHKHHDPKVVLPEKHHHYEDGFTSSSSESSNEGEKKRAAEHKLGSHAYDGPIANNDPYLNNRDQNPNLHGDPR